MASMNQLLMIAALVVFLEPASRRGPRRQRTILQTIHDLVQGRRGPDKEG
jgi:hypothetical protein